MGEIRAYSRFELFPSVRWLPAAEPTQTEITDDAALQRMCTLKQIREELKEDAEQKGR